MYVGGFVGTPAARVVGTPAARDQWLAPQIQKWVSGVCRLREAADWHGRSNRSGSISSE